MRRRRRPRKRDWCVGDEVMSTFRLIEYIKEGAFRGVSKIKLTTALVYST